MNAKDDLDVSTLADWVGAAAATPREDLILHGENLELLGGFADGAFQLDPDAVKPGTGV